jgi:predicted lipoprotein with Yx(FWY)xxD motif
MNAPFTHKLVRPASLLGLLAILAIILAACAPAATPTTTPAVTIPTQASSAGETISINTSSNSALGFFLVNGQGMALYIFKNDTPNTSTCSGTCLKLWAPLVTSGTPKASPGVDASLLGVATQSNGEKIVTYDQKPLYTKLTDTSSGQTTGEDVGNAWFVISPDGEPIVATSTIPTVVVANDPALGQILVDGQGLTLYMFKNDTPNTSACSGECLALWSPLITTGTPVAGSGVDASLLGTATQSNGVMIVTYNNMPLYTKPTDTQPGQTTGQGFKDLWYVVSPAGQPIISSSSATPTPAPTTVSSTGSTSATPPATQAATLAPVSEPTINVTYNPSLGNILTANKGMTLYAYKADTADTSNCNAICQKVWMPLLTNGNPTLGTGVTASMIGTAKLSDGSMVVTYNHIPLYTFINDPATGMTNGQGFDNVWFAVSPDGKLVGNETEVSLNLATNPLLGTYLVGQGGQAIYVYTKDTPDTSTCTGVCVTIWPPVLTLGKPNLGSGVDSTLVGMLKLPDGSLMLTYNHKPLYYYVGDAAPTDVKGQGFKDIWYVLDPPGNNITTLIPTAPATEPTLNVVNNATYGQILTDGNGMTLYANLNDLKGQSSCDAACLQNWTPLYTRGHPNIGPGVNASLVGAITTSYGLMIATYNGHPLYLYKGDKHAGDVSGEDLNITWYVISESGQVITRR